MINRIKINNLFGRFNYDIATMAGGITIITGPNGFGKSTILKIINALSEGKIGYFFKIEFDQLTVEFDNGQSASIRKNKKGLQIDDIIVSDVDEDFEISRIYSRPWIRRTADGFYDIRTDEHLTDEELLFREILSDDRYISSYSKEKDKRYVERIKNKISQLRDWCGEVRFISDQRLIKMQLRRREEKEVIDVIKELPRRLKTEISNVTEKYSNVANNLDGSYPKRLFAAKEGIKDELEYLTCLEEANKKFQKLNAYNLVDISMIDEKNYKPEYSTALKIYFEDFAKKYSVFQDLIAKLDLFTRIINSRLMFKHIRIIRDKGFVVVDNDNENKVLELSELSSGEKQEIVLFYELIFDTKEKLLLLIDEPEISLHITWQKKFLDDLIEVSKQTTLQIIVATHSPQIVSNHMDIQIDLGELYGRELNTR